MGGQIAKFAFLPPDPAAAERMLLSNPHHSIIFNARHNPVSLVRIPATRPVLPGRRLTVIFSHGNAEDLSNYTYYAELSRQLGVDVVAYDYSGYGLSTSRQEYFRRQGAVDNLVPVKSGLLGCRCTDRNAADSTKRRIRPTEVDAFSCAEAVFAHVTGTTDGALGVRESDVIVMGRSLGSGPATHLAEKHPGIHAFVLLSPLKSCAHVANTAAGVALYPFDIMANIRKVAAITMPTLIVHGTADEVIPYTHAVEIAQKIRSAAKNPHVHLLTVKGAGHNDVEDHMGWQKFFATVKQFIVKPDATPQGATTM
jgi:pimeloyl-ACP methyl ester carboxylesterase